MNDSPVAILFDANGNPISVINSALHTVNVATTGTISSVAISTADTLLLDVNTNRRGALIYNDATSATVKIGLSSTTVSATNFSVEISAGGFFEIPFGYTGQIRAIWSTSETGAARITELT